MMKTKATFTITLFALISFYANSQQIILTKKNVNKGFEDMKLAIINTSDTSLSLLSQYSPYLVENKIPIIIIGSEQKDVTKINKKYPGLLAGVAPKPSHFIKKMMSNVGVSSVPVIIHRGVILQKAQR